MLYKCYVNYVWTLNLKPAQLLVIRGGQKTTKQKQKSRLDISSGRSIELSMNDILWPTFSAKQLLLTEKSPEWAGEHTWCWASGTKYAKPKQVHLLKKPSSLRGDVGGIVKCKMLVEVKWGRRLEDTEVCSLHVLRVKAALLEVLGLTE